MPEKDPVYGLTLEANKTATYNTRQHGVFGANPLMTPKYARNLGERDAEFKETLARMYIALPQTGSVDEDQKIREAYLASLPQDDRTQALAKVLLASGEGGTGFIDFFLASAQESFQEVVQVDKVLADDYVAFFYGQSPPQFQYSGYLINSQQDDQRLGFALAYQHMLRGTQLARRGALVRLRYDSVIVSGALLATQQSLAAENELAVPFSFSILVKEYVVLENNTQFSRKTPQDYVELSTKLEADKLGSVGIAEDTRVRASVVTPEQRAAVSAAGTEDTAFTVANATLGNPTGAGLATAARNLYTSARNVYGTITGNPAKPVPPPDATTPPVIENGVRIDPTTGQPVP